MTMSDYHPSLAGGKARTDWSGQWIWHSPESEARNAYAMFRRTFRTRAAGKLRIHVVADSFYTLYLDGRRCARGPARSHLGYVSFDSLDLPLPAGRHCLAVLVHHVGEVNATMMRGRPALLADVHAGGEDLSTGPAWRCRAGDAWQADLPEMMSHFGFPEVCDLSKAPAGWTMASFDDADWSGATVIGRPGCEPWGALVPRDIPMLTWDPLPRPAVVASGTWTATGVDSPTPSRQAAARVRHRDAKTCPLPLSDRRGRARYVTLDFGRTVSGYLTLRFSGAQGGQQVDISYDELLTDDGAVNPERTYAHLTDRFLLPDGDGEFTTTHPRGWRYVTIDLSAGPGRIEAVEAHEELYPFTARPAFASNRRDLDDFFVRSALTVRVCTSDAFTDCCTRERVQWMEDMYMHGLVSAYAFADTAMTRRALLQGAQSALPDGRINGFFPSERTNCAFAASSLMWLAMLTDYWLHSGDRETLDAVAGTARRLLGLLESLVDESGLIASWPAGQFWEWSPIEQSGCLLLTNAACAWILGRFDEHPELQNALGCEELAARADRIRHAAHERFWLPDRGLYGDAVLPDGTLSPVVSQAANAMACLAGVPPEPVRAEVLRRIIDPAALGAAPVGEASLKPTGRVAGGPVVPVGTLWFAHWLVRALFEAGLDEQAVSQMRLFWGAYPDLPTFPETRIQGGNTGVCHGWAAGPAYLLPAYVLGISPTAGGWRRASFHPRTAGASRASGEFATPRGPFKASWRKNGGSVALALTVPPGMVVDVRLGDVCEQVAGPAEWSRSMGATR